MAGDNFKRVKVGQALDDVLTVDVLNELLDVVRERRQARQKPRKQDESERDDPNIVWIKNVTGGPRKRWDVVALDYTAPLFNPTAGGAALHSFREKPRYVKAIAPSFPTHLGRFAVLQEPCDVNKFAPAIMGGLTPAWVLGNEFRLLDGEPGYADIAPGAPEPGEGEDPLGPAESATIACGPLVPRMFGGAEIQWIADNPITGETYGDERRLALVRLGHFHNPIFLVELTEDLEPDEGGATDPDDEGAEGKLLYQLPDGSWFTYDGIQTVRVRWPMFMADGKVASGSRILVQGNRHSGRYNMLTAQQYYLSPESANHMAAFRPGDTVATLADLGP